MRQLRFNFNNEVDSFEIIEQDDKTIHVPMPGGDEIVYDNIQQFAEFYAQARDVKPEHLKNWVLVENGDVVSFILRAGTAGVSAEEAQESLDRIFRELRENGQYHPLEVERLRQTLNGAEDVMATLAMSDRPELAQVIYDRLNEMHVFDEPEQEPEEEPDTRSDMERYLDIMLESDKTLAVFGEILNLGPAAGKEEILEALEASTIPYTVASLSTLYEQVIHNAIVNGINVDDRMDAILVVSQFAMNDPDACRKLEYPVRLAGRNFLNVTKYTVGRHHIRKESQILDLAELDGVVFLLKDNQPVVINFDAEVDAALEEERARQEEEDAARREAEAEDYEDDGDYDYEDDYEDYDED